MIGAFNVEIEVFSMRGLDAAGHWVQQEQPDEVNRLLLAFLASAGDA